MDSKRLHRHAWVVLILNALYSIADALCSVFVGVYFWINSLDFQVVCHHYMALYAVTPCVFLLAGWYSQARDRVHVFRLGLLLHAVYYGALLWLQEDSPAYAVPLGVLLGVTWGFFWAGSNTFSFDVTTVDKREYFLGFLGAIIGVARLVAPLISAAIIYLCPSPPVGYHLIFFLAVLIYLSGIVLSYWVPADKTRRPFRVRRALFPGRQQRDWRLIMLTSLALAGSYNIFQFLLALVMYMQSGSEMSVGGFAAIQAFAGIVASYLVGRFVVPRTRKASMFWGTLLLVAAGVFIGFKLTVFTLVIFGFLRAVAQPLFSIPHTGIRFDVIDRCAEEPAQRIEYLCAWEVPLAIGRLVMMTLLILLSQYLSEAGLRIALFLLCANRIAAYLLLRRISIVRQAV